MKNKNIFILLLLWPSTSTPINFPDNQKSMFFSGFSISLGIFAGLGTWATLTFTFIGIVKYLIQQTPKKTTPNKATLHPTLNEIVTHENIHTYTLMNIKNPFIFIEGNEHDVNQQIDIFHKNINNTVSISVFPQKEDLNKEQRLNLAFQSFSPPRSIILTYLYNEEKVLNIEPYTRDELARYLEKHLTKNIDLSHFSNLTLLLQHNHANYTYVDTIFNVKSDKKINIDNHRQLILQMKDYLVFCNAKYNQNFIVQIINPKSFNNLLTLKKNGSFNKIILIDNFNSEQLNLPNVQDIITSSIITDFT
jgi:hypothetical protein